MAKFKNYEEILEELKADVQIGAWAVVEGDVKVEGGHLDIAAGAVVLGNVEVKDGNLNIFEDFANPGVDMGEFAVIVGNVKVESGDCDIDIDAEIKGIQGNLEGTCAI